MNAHDQASLRARRAAERALIAVNARLGESTAGASLEPSPPLPDLADATDPRFTDGQREQLARINAAPAAPESFDPIAALRRVEALAADFDDGSEWGAIVHPGYAVRNRIREAIAGDR